MNPCIVVDARMVGMGGIGRYVESLLKAMITARPRTRWILLGDPGRLRRFEGVEIRPCRVPIYSASEWLGMGSYFKGADLVHVPHFNAPAASSEKLIVTIHDLIHFEVPEYQPFPGAKRLLDWRMKHLLKRADGVLAVSEGTSSALQARYPHIGLASKTHVTWEAADEIFGVKPLASDTDTLLRLGVTEPFFLYVGAIREHKETHRLLEAFVALKGRNAGSAQLVLSGRVDARFDRKHDFLKKISARSDVRLLTDIADVDLSALYRRATALVMPSRIEGFGLPVLEAMQSGVPVIASGIPVLKEIGGSAALYFDPGQIDALCGLLYNVLHDTELRSRLVHDGLEQSRQFRWSLTAQQTLKVYDQILEHD